MTVTLRPMRADEYPAWAEQGERGYVHQMVEFGGMEREHAAAKAVRDFATVLPEGLETKGHWLARDRGGWPGGRLPVVRGA
jgi:hypothetical protein